MNARTFPTLLAGVLLGVGSLTCFITPADASPLTISAAFDFDTFGPDTPVTSIALSAGAWHVDSADGALASDSQVYSVLANLTGMTIGATAAGKPLANGSTVPFGFFLNSVYLGAVVHDDFLQSDGGGWTTTDNSGVNWIWQGWGGSLGGTIYRLNRTPEPIFFGFNAAPISWSGNLSGGFGQALSFHFGSYFDVAGPAYYDVHSGRVFLTGNVEDDVEVPQVPEPASLSLLSIGLAAVAFRRRKSPTSSR
jgi:PEP-CTERM motif